jgi:hypothetical protein
VSEDSPPPYVEVPLADRLAELGDLWGAPSRLGAVAAGSPRWKASRASYGASRHSERQDDRALRVRPRDDTEGDRRACRPVGIGRVPGARTGAKKLRE